MGDENSTQHMMGQLVSAHFDSHACADTDLEVDMRMQQQPEAAVADLEYVSDDEQASSLLCAMPDRVRRAALPRNVEQPGCTFDPSNPITRQLVVGCDKSC